MSKGRNALVPGQSESCRTGSEGIPGIKQSRLTVIPLPVLWRLRLRHPLHPLGQPKGARDVPKPVTSVRSLTCTQTWDAGCRGAWLWSYLGGAWLCPRIYRRTGALGVWVLEHSPSARTSQCGPQGTSPVVWKRTKFSTSLLETGWEDVPTFYEDSRQEQPPGLLESMQAG